MVIYPQHQRCPLVIDPRLDRRYQLDMDTALSDGDCEGEGDFMRTKHHPSALWSALLPDERLQRAVSPNYWVTTKDGSVKELCIEDHRLIVILKKQGWTVEKIGEPS